MNVKDFLQKLERGREDILIIIDDMPSVSREYFLASLNFEKAYDNYPTATLKFMHILAQSTRDDVIDKIASTPCIENDEKLQDILAARVNTSYVLLNNHGLTSPKALLILCSRFPDDVNRKIDKDKAFADRLDYVKINYSFRTEEDRKKDLAGVLKDLKLIS